MDDPYRVDVAPGEDTTGVWVPGAPVAAAWRALGLVGVALALALPGTMLLDALAGLGVLPEGAMLVPAVAALGLFVAAGVAARRCLPPATGPWTRGTRRLARLVLATSVVAVAWLGLFLLLVAGEALLNPRL